MNLKSFLIAVVLMSSLGFGARAQNYLYWDSGYTEYIGLSVGSVSGDFVIIIQDDKLLSDRSDSLNSLNCLFLFGSSDTQPESWTEDTIMIQSDWSMSELKGSIQFDESGFEADLSKSTHCRNINDSTESYVLSNSKLIIKKNRGGKKMTMQVILHWCHGSTEEVLNKTFVVRRKN